MSLKLTTGDILQTRRVWLDELDNNVYIHVGDTCVGWLGVHEEDGDVVFYPNRPIFDPAIATDEDDNLFVSYNGGLEDC
jgi:hypothetical protein